MGRVRTLLDFVKFEHTLFSLPLLLAGAWLGAGGTPPAGALLWVLVAGTGARTLAMALNRIIDRRIDARNPRTADRELRRGGGDRVSRPPARAIVRSADGRPLERQRDAAAARWRDDRAHGRGRRRSHGQAVRREGRSR